MILNKDTATKTAELLLQINAIKLSLDSPFTWASGLQSPIYCDNRIILSYPVIRNYVREEIAKQLEDRYGKPDAVVGVATGAIGMGVLVADYLGLPFAYVRPEAKKHGRQNQIEGKLEPNQSVVVIEDLISTGKSSLNAVKALKENQIKIKGMFAVFTYGFDIALKNFQAEELDLFTLSDYDYLIDQAVSTGYINAEQQYTLLKWRKNPTNWQP